MDDTARVGKVRFLGALLRWAVVDRRRQDRERSRINSLQRFERVFGGPGIVVHIRSRLQNWDDLGAGLHAPVLYVDGERTADLDLYHGPGEAYVELTPGRHSVEILIPEIELPGRPRPVLSSASSGVIEVAVPEQGVVWIRCLAPVGMVGRIRAEVVS
jgi:hypothetical protein